jgi:predicted Zn-dependent peptidase
LSPRGLTVTVAPLPHLRTATVAAFVRVGSRHETPENNGIAHFLEHMIFRGTARHPSSYALNLAIESLGGSLDGETHADMTVFHATVPPAHAGEAARVLGEMLTAPIFADLDVERGVVREELLEDVDEDGNDVNADNAIRRLLFAPHPLGLPIPGTIANLERFDTRGLSAHLASRYVRPATTVVATGAVDPARIADEIAAAFEPMPEGTPPGESPPVPKEAAERYLWIEDSGSQSQLRLSFPTFGESDPRSAALHVLARVLHDGLASRVPRRISDEAGLAYDAFASLEIWSDAGALDFGATVSSSKAGRVLSAFGSIVRDLVRDGLEPEELERKKRRWLFQLEAQQDDAVSTAFFHGTSDVLGRPGEDPAALGARVSAVTLAEVRGVVEEILSLERLCCVCVGDRTAGRRARRAFAELLV